MRPEKQTIIEEYAHSVGQSPFVLLTDFTGMKVEHFMELRERLSQVNAEYHVVKNTLIRRALNEANLPDLSGFLSGQTAVVFGENDVSAAAKVVKNFHREFERPLVRAGIFDEKIFQAEQINELASLPSLDVMRAQFLGLLKTPAGNFVRLAHAPAQNFARLLKAKIESEEESKN